MPDFRLLFRCLICAAGVALAGAVTAGSYDDILIAAEKGDSTQVIDLLKRGMDVNTTDSTGNTLLIIAARTGNTELLDFLLRNRANALKRNKYGDSALMVAAFRGDAATVQRLLDAKAPPNHDGWTALHYAAYGGNAEIIRLLAAHDADLDAEAPNGQTALMLAANNGKLDAVKVLVDADADLDLEDREGRTALMLAQAGGHTEVVDYLRSSGAYED